MSLDSINIKLYLSSKYTFMLLLYVRIGYKQINKGSSKYGTIV